MKTKFDIDDLVYIPAKVVSINIDNRGNINCSVYVDETFGRTTSYNTLSIDEDYIVKADNADEQQTG